MSKKINIDRAFRSICQNHEAKYDPNDWTVMQEKLKAAGLQNHTHWWTRLNSILQKSLALITTIGLVLLPTGQVTQFQSLNLNNAYEVNSTNNKSNNHASLSSETHQGTQQASVAIPQESLANPLASTNRLGLETDSQEPNSPKIIETPQDAKPEQKIWARFIEQGLEMKSKVAASALLKEEDAVSPNDSLPNPQDSIIAQHEKPKHYDVEKAFKNLKPVQFSLFAPLSTRGAQAKYGTHRFSVNALLGSAAGIDALDISGLGSVVSRKVEGAQIAGLFNLDKGSLKGVQLSSVLNMVGEDTEGAQISGLVNVSGYKKARPGDNEKVQLQIAGLFNESHNNSKTSQISGLVNHADYIRGVQIAGMTNVANQVEGVQLGGLNVARRVKGVQIGLFNVADTVDGIPIGLFSYVKQNGYRHIEFWGGDTFHANVGLKIGVRRFYNIIAVGLENPQALRRWGIGYGVGSQFDFGNRAFMNLELLAFHVNENESFTKRFNLLNQLRFNFGVNVGDHFGLFGGPSFNFLLSDFRNENNSIGSEIAPSWILFEAFNQGISIRAWLGFNLGIRF